MDPDVQLTSQDSVYLITKATELFIEMLTLEGYSFTQKTGRKTLTRQDIDAAIDTVDPLAFLEGSIVDMPYQAIYDGRAKPDDDVPLKSE